MSDMAEGNDAPHGPENQAQRAKRLLGVTNVDMLIPGMRASSGSPMPFISSKHKNKVDPKTLDDDEDRRDLFKEISSQPPVAAGRTPIHLAYPARSPSALPSPTPISLKPPAATPMPVLSAKKPAKPPRLDSPELSSPLTLQSSSFPPSTLPLPPPFPAPRGMEESMATPKQSGDRPSLPKRAPVTRHPNIDTPWHVQDRLVSGASSLPTIPASPVSPQNIFFPQSSQFSSPTLHQSISPKSSQFSSPASHQPTSPKSSQTSFSNLHQLMSPKSPAGPSYPPSLPTTPSLKVAPSVAGVLVGFVPVNCPMKNLSRAERQSVAEACRSVVLRQRSVDRNNMYLDSIGTISPRWQGKEAQVVAGGGSLQVLCEGQRIIAHAISDVSVIMMPSEQAGTVVYVARCQINGRIGVLLSFPSPDHANAIVKVFEK